MLVEGLGGPFDKDRALQLFEQAAQTDADAMTALGRRYEFGDGITKDLGKAVEWYQKAITAGNNSYSTRGAYFALGSLAIKETPPDLEKVESLFEKAEGPRNLALRFLDGDGLPQNYAKARVWLEKGISLDSPKAAMFLATYLMRPGLDPGESCWTATKVDLDSPTGRRSCGAESWPPPNATSSSLKERIGASVAN